MIRMLALAALLSGATGLALAETPDDGGTLNPEELTLGSTVDKARRGQADMTICMQAYFAIKSGAYEDGQAILDACVAAGFTGAMHWKSYAATNGLGVEESAEAAAAWDRKAAELGDPIGKFNHGLNMLRGYGVARDDDAAKRWIDEAARDGVESAIELKQAGYDPDVVTPDADNWRYEGPRAW